jgi:hypothetical protein
MRASEFITEVFQPGKTNWKWRRQSSDEAFASFVVGDREYQWHAVHWCPDPTKWEIQFRLMREKTDPDGLDLFGRTGTGNSAQVLSTAVDITREFIKQYGIDKVKEIKFNAKEDSRIGLYAKMIQRLLPDWDLYQKYTKYNGMEYRLTDPRAYDKPENKITERQGVAEDNLKEFAPVGGDNREPDEEELLRQLASMWWLGTEQQMIKAQKTLAAMGWEIGQDESGDDDAGVFVIRVGDVNGDSYMAFPHSELNLNEGLSKGT